MTMPRRRPPLFVIIWVAVGLAVVATVIAVDATSHRPGPAAAPPPKPAPGLTLPSLRDPAERVTLGAYQGRPVIVNFFASWCGPCQQETPLLARYYASTHGKVAIIGVDADDSAANAMKFLTAKGVGYPVGFESTPALSDAYGVSEIGIPQTFFLNARHRIVKRVIGGVTTNSLTAGVALMDRTT
jgi:cytochrome c biogenesis protein CcmG, thiol:disulfide interchange protein DsbE